jgi:predicted O-linked N-acetylglucosamine transferase (SPINDLY family)
MLPNDPDNLFAEALDAHLNGRIQEAFTKYGQILERHPNHPETLHHLGLIYLQSGDLAQAIPKIKKSLESDPKNSNALSNLGYCFNTLGEFKAAIDCCHKALQINPSNDGAWTNLGNAQRGCSLWGAAQDSYQKALNIQPNNPRYIYNLANTYYDQEDFHRASNLFKQCLAIENRIPEAQNNLSACLIKLKDPATALLHVNASIELKPDYAEAWSNRGNALNDLKRHEEALASYNKSIELKPDYAEAWSNRGNALNDLKRHEEALASFNKSIELKPDIDFILGTLVSTQMKLCDWIELGQRRQALERKLLGGSKASGPFAVLGLFDNPKLQKRCAEIYAQEKFSLKGRLGVIAQKPKRDKIRIGYFSMDFKDHPVSHLIAELFELHDRSKFELHGFSFGVNTRDTMRQRIEKSLDNFLDVKHLSDLDIAHLSRQLEIDIAIDLGGYTRDSRPQIFAERAAPIQINYLGFPGTMGTQYLDYLMADPQLISPDTQDAYAEKIIYLPNSYQVNDSKRKISDRIFTRQEVGLPEHGVILCCFNNNWKILPEIFDRWMSILRSVDGSVLWLYEDNPTAAKNLRKEATNRNIDADRLVFARRMPHTEHLARYKLADLFLDTFPYNAHTTASDALWAGVPVLTLQGQSFAARVASSLLTNIGISDLITHTKEEYSSLAVEFASNPEKLAKIKTKLTQNRLTTPLFDTKLFARHIESAYQSAYDRYHAGLPTDHIYINP